MVLVNLANILTFYVGSVALYPCLWLRLSIPQLGRVCHLDMAAFPNIDIFYSPSSKAPYHHLPAGMSYAITHLLYHLSLPLAALV
jgi:hypothetical protein